MTKSAASLVLCALILVLSSFQSAESLRVRDDDHHPGDAQQKDANVNSKVHHLFRGLGELYNGNSGSGSGFVGNILYQGGTLMADAPINVYLIFYGNWGGSGPGIISNFVRSLSDTSTPKPSVANWWNISTAYYMKDQSGDKKYVSSQVNLAGTTFDSYSQNRYWKKFMGQRKVPNVVINSINQGKLKFDPNGIYLVLTSADIGVNGLCSQYCGYHSSATYNGQTFLYALVGNAGRCLSSCAIQTTSPNGNAGVDGMISVIAHELTETVTDPLGDGWLDDKGEENGDMCAWKFGTTLKGKDGNGNQFQYNMVGSGGAKYLVQQNMDVAQQGCITQAGSTVAQS